ncbi:MAG TPA: hypothetical protein VE869_16620 [Gemmatimonas sp.]|nr:hypothetical protein [Gemmatimonas sp.]
MARLRRRMAAAIVLLAIVLAVDGILVWRRSHYRAETARLRAGMTDIERRRTDAILEAESDESGLMLELMRRQASGDDRLHLAVSAESSFVALDRGAARLRVMAAVIGPEGTVGTAPDTSRIAVPRGSRTIERLLAAEDAYPLPAWVWTTRGKPVPENRAAPGLVGANAIVTTGGTLIYAMPGSGPLADSAFVMPGAIRVRAADLAAIRENLTRGMTVYFY